MKLNLTDGNWRFGSYHRGMLAGDILLGQYSFGDIFAVLAPRMVFARDAWAEKAKERGWISSDQAAVYSEKLNGLLSQFVGDMETPYESIYQAVCELRRREFGPDQIDEVFLKMARSPDACQEEMDIDQEETGRELARTRPHILFVLEDPAMGPWMLRDARSAGEQGAKVYFSCGNEENASLPGAAVMEALTGAVPAVEMGKNGIREADGKAELAEAVKDGKACLFWYGDTGLSACRCLNVPAMVKCVPRSLVGKALAGQFAKAGRCAVYVPAHFDILPFVPLTRPTLAAYRQLAWLRKRYGDAVYEMTAEEMYRRWPETFFSVYEEGLPGLPEGMAWQNAAAASGDWYADFCASRQKTMDEFLDQTPGVHRLNGWFELDTLARKPIPWNASGDARGILVHGMLMDQIADAGVMMAEGKPLSLRKLLMDQKDAPKLQIFCNYLFFMTSRLVTLYNRLRQDRPREHIRFQGGHMDYVLYHENGKRIETFPLYHKACMGMTEEGRFVFFHFALRGGECVVNGQTIYWKESDVNPDSPGAAAVYTPYLSCPDQGASRFEYLKTVGEGRVNFVLHQNELICVRDGDVALPSIGVVLSLRREEGLLLAKKCGLEPAGEGYYAWKEKPRLEIRLEHPADVPLEVWKTMKWAYGGGLTLARDGQCVFARDRDAAAFLKEEGWASPLSSQTQESDIAAMMRHPRTAIGLTRSGKLFMLVFSGRSSVSAGADYVEMCEIARQLVPDLQDMINVDGGASSVLGLGLGQRFLEYSRPSTSFDSLAGMVRPVNSAFRVIPG